MQKIALLYDASQAVLSTFNLDEVLVQILWIVRDYFHITNAAVLLLNPNTQEFFVRTSIGRPEDETEVRIPFGKGLIGTAAQEKKPVYAPDASQDSRYIPLFPDTKCEVAIPLMVRDEVVGVLDIQSEKLDAFDSETLDLLTLFSTVAANHVNLTQLLTEYSRDLAQNFISEQVSELVIQALEVIDIDHDDGHAPVVTRSPFDFRADLQLEIAAIVDAGESIDVR